MEIREFVETAISGILNGIDSAQASGSQVKVSRHTGSGADRRNAKLSIDFDLAVTTTYTSSNKEVVAVDVGGSGNLSRIRFSVPVELSEK